MKQETKTPEYQNNPFLVAFEGIKLFFAYALSVAILMIVLAVLNSGSQAPQVVYDIHNGTFTNTPEEQEAKDLEMFKTVTNTVSGLSTQEWAMIGSIAVAVILLFLIIGTILGGINDYTAAQLAKHKKTTLGEAFRAVMPRFFSYLWLNILIGIKVLLWSLLFVIPGIIMAVRYSLAGTAFFSEDLKGNIAIKRSLTLTKGAWLTTFGSFALFNFITLGLIQPILQPGTQAVLYRQYTAYEAAKLEKPAAHGLSWLALFLPIILLTLLMTFVFIIAFFISSTIPQ